MNLESRLQLVQEVGEEIITPEELRTLMETKQKLVAYDGFEPSGNIHIAQGLLRAINVNKITAAGIKFKFLIADWHAAANLKFEGNLETIHKVGEFFIEVWKACEMDFANIEFIWASDIAKDPDYWKLVLQIASNSTLDRVKRCTQIMGRKESDTLRASQILYPCMQAADIFHLKVNICQLGMDQRKVNMLAREVAPKLGFTAPVAIHHHMLMGLLQPSATDLSGIERIIDMKMSKSNPASAVFMLDSPEEVTSKIVKKAWCPAKQATDNPILEYAKYIIFGKNKELTFERPAKFGGPLTFKSYPELEAAFVGGQLHPLDLKKGVAVEINRLLEPIRKYFAENEHAKELLAFVRTQMVTK
ncbi:MAG: tyrosyl-tRNA synthetase [Promethearchaeota archaeon CR_4]|nr:MAG: tyrosyl-tRNA synthetase [Candidatus Lokiarchaeota archaeon CR_4]